VIAAAGRSTVNDAGLHPVLLAPSPSVGPAAVLTTPALPPLAAPATAIEEPAALPSPSPSSSARPSRLQRHALSMPGEERVDHRGAGELALRAGRIDDAVVSFRKALAIDGSAPAWAALGDAYLRSGAVVAGLECLEEAVALDVDDVDARRLLVRQYLADEQGRRARLHAEEWVRIEPQSPSARQALGRAYSQLGMWRQAIDQFRLVVAVQPDNAWAHNNLGFAALQLGDDVTAIEHLERALDGRPQHASMFNNLGVAYERIGHLAFAHAAFSRAAELSPKYASAALNRDRVQTILDESNRVAAAAQLLRFRDAAIEDPHSPTADDRAEVALPATPTFAGAE
jgi:tetratricopeptide (TPR) repeat protein